MHSSLVSLWNRAPAIMSIHCNVRPSGWKEVLGDDEAQCSSGASMFYTTCLDGELCVSQLRDWVSTAVVFSEGKKKQSVFYTVVWWIVLVPCHVCQCCTMPTLSIVRRQTSLHVLSVLHECTFSIFGMMYDINYYHVLSSFIDDTDPILKYTVMGMIVGTSL